MKWGYISAQKLETYRARLLPVSISLKTKPSEDSLESWGLENIPKVSAN